jgi:hypothetical protein
MSQTTKQTKAAKDSQQSVFEVLSAINVNEHLEKKEGMSYLSFPWAWSIVKKIYPDAKYKVIGKEEDADLGCMVHTCVTIQDETIDMWLPVMDGKHKAMKRTEYSYTTKYGPKTVEAYNMHDINRTIMRCLVKNIAMFGLGIYVYAGEDLPQSDKVESPVADTPAKPSANQKQGLAIGTPNWSKVELYVSSNKNLGIDAIIQQLSRKYVITDSVHNEIVKLCNQ